MNQTLELISRRKSTRVYSDRALTEIEKDTILQAAFRAPTAGNMMLYSIIEVEDQVLKDRLAQTCDDQPFIARAPYVLLFLADYQRWFDSFELYGAEKRCRELNLEFRKPQEGDLLLACCDALIAAQTAVIAAESLGIGSCYIGDILENYEIHRDLFSLPPYTLPVTLLCFGYPASERDSSRRTTRFERKYVAHKNAYHRLNKEELEQMYQPLKEQAFHSEHFFPGSENIPQHYYLKKFIADFSIEMNRSVKEMLKNWL
jgi:nitroreductase